MTVALHAEPANHASRRVAEKCGFVRVPGIIMLVPGSIALRGVIALIAFLEHGGEGRCLVEELAVATEEVVVDTNSGCAVRQVVPRLFRCHASPFGPKKKGPGLLRVLRPQCLRARLRRRPRPDAFLAPHRAVRARSRRRGDRLQIETLFCVIGGSMGGMQVLQWTAAYPQRVFSALPVACSTRHSAQNIAFHELGRQAVMADPEWHHGRYFEQGTHPHRGQVDDDELRGVRHEHQQPLLRLQAQLPNLWIPLPDSYLAYKRQRDRWAYGGFQIVKKHWRRFLPGRSLLTRGGIGGS